MLLETSQIPRLRVREEALLYPRYLQRVSRLVADQLRSQHKDKRVEIQESGSGNRLSLKVLIRTAEENGDVIAAEDDVIPLVPQEPTPSSQGSDVSVFPRVLKEIQPQLRFYHEELFNDGRKTGLWMFL